MNNVRKSSTFGRVMCDVVITHTLFLADPIDQKLGTSTSCKSILRWKISLASLVGTGVSEFTQMDIFFFYIGDRRHLAWDS